MEFSQDEKGTMVKRLHAGRAAQAGVVAADLAKRGLTAPKSSLDGKYGYCRVYSDEPDADAIARALGDDFQIRHNNFKPYACCGMLHASVDAIVDLMAAHRFSAKDVSAVVIGGSRALVEQHASTTPESVMAAQYSMPYSAAAALLGRAMDPRVFDEATCKDTSILAIARSVKLEVDPAMEAMFPEKFGGSVRIRMQDGKQVQATVTEARGTTGNPITRDALVGKVRALCEGLLELGTFDELVHLVLHFDTVSDPLELPRLLDRIVIQTARPN
jgi:2-methylcitrate dehydratase PrpD